MPKLISEGCVVTCSHCRSVLSFVPSEVHVSSVAVAAGHSPEEEAYMKSVYSVACPKCKGAVDVGSSLGPDGKRSASARAEEARKFEDHNL